MLKNIQLEKRIKQILCVLLSGTMIIDYINGSFPSLKIGTILRLLLIFLCFLNALILNYRLLHKYLLILGFLGINVLISVKLNGTQALVDVKYAVKNMLCYLIASSLVELWRQGYLSMKDIDTILTVNLLSGPALYMISFFLGNGTASYEFENVSIGSKANFLSLNSVNIAFLVLYIFALSKFFQSWKMKWGMACVFVAIPLLLLGTKTSLVMLMFCPLLFIGLNLGKKKKFQHMEYYLLAGGILLALIGPRLLPSIRAVLMRQKLLLGRRDFLTYLFSTRNVRLAAVTQEYLRTFSILDLITGRGYFGIHHFVAAYLNSTELVLPIEMDFFDIFFSYGIPGLLYTYCFALKPILGTRKWNEEHIQGYFWSSLLVLAYAVLAGHLFQEAISSTFYGICIAGLSIGKKVFDNER